MYKKFSDSEVLAIINSDLSTAQLAQQYGVGYHVIYNILTGKTYTDVTHKCPSLLRNTDSETILDLVRANYSLSAIAAFTGLSARAIGRLWLRETGTTIREYRKQNQVRYGEKI